MTSLLSLGTALALSALQGEVTGVSDLEGRLRLMFDASLGDVEAPRREGYLRTLVGRMATMPLERRRAVLDGLPSALDFHIQVIRSTSFTPPPEALPPGFNMPALSAAERAEGMDLQMAYLADRVSRAGRMRTDPATLNLLQIQIRSVTAGFETALQAQFPGEAGHALARREASALRDTWIGSLGLPFQAIIDLPLEESELARVVADISGKVSAPPVILRPEEILNEETLDRAGALAHVERLREACYELSRSCFREFQPHDVRTLDWIRRAQSNLEGALARAIPAAATAEAPSLARAPSMDPPHAPPALLTRMSESLPAEKPSPSSSPSSGRGKALGGIFGALLTVLGVLLVIRRKRIA